MNFPGLAGIVVVLVTAVLILLGSSKRSRRELDDRTPGRTLRPLPAFDRLRRALNLAVEDGSRVHVSLGSASLVGPQSAASLAGLEVLDRLAQRGSASDRPPVATSGEGSLAILSQDTLREGFRTVNALPEFDATRGRLTGLTPFSYALGAVQTVREDQVSANVLLGNFGPEVVFLTDAAESVGALSIAGTGSLPAQALLFATVEEPLVGEEAYAGGAYLPGGTMQRASLHAQDILRWGLAVVLVAGAILALAGIL